jgi:hypothetical protein
MVMARVSAWALDGALRPSTAVTADAILELTSQWFCNQARSKNMVTVEEAVLAYAAAWNENNASKRRGLIDQC